MEKGLSAFSRKKFLQLRVRREKFVEARETFYQGERGSAHHHIITFDASHDAFETLVLLSRRQMRVHAANKIIYRVNLSDEEEEEDKLIALSGWSALEWVHLMTFPPWNEEKSNTMESSMTDELIGLTLMRFASRFLIKTSTWWGKLCSLIPQFSPLPRSRPLHHSNRASRIESSHDELALFFHRLLATLNREIRCHSRFSIGGSEEPAQACTPTSSRLPFAEQKIEIFLLPE